MTGQWKDVIISESLEEPSLLNGFDVYGTRISKRDQSIDDRGHKERWHLYWCTQQTSKSELSQAKSREVGTLTFGKTKGSWQFFAAKSSSSSPGTSRPGKRLSNMASPLESLKNNLTFQQTIFLGH